MGEVAPNIRYNETPDVIEQGFTQFIKAGGDKVNDLHELTALLDSLKLKNALRFGIESAYIHMLCHAEKMAIHELLHIPIVNHVATSYTMPILEMHEVKEFYQANNLSRFEIIKLKLNTDNGLELLKIISEISNQPIIIDPNEAYTNADDLLRFLRKLTPYNIVLVEQPMPAICVDDYKTVKKAALFPVMADESICDGANFEELRQQFDYVNMKLMKAGGYLNGINILETAKENNMKTMVGCMVETSLGISSALHLCGNVNYADLDGFMIVKDEPFGLLHEKNGVITLSKASNTSIPYKA